MMDYPLTLTHFAERARTYFPKRQVVSRDATGAIHRTTYADLYARACRLANALARLGVKQGDRVATLAWNNHRHFEAYIAIPSMGAVLHTLNLRLHPTELTYIASHAEDSVVLVDRSLLPLLRKFVDDVKSIRHVVVMPDCPATLPSEGYAEYEDLLRRESDSFAWPDLDERQAAALCYTSGTTGHPKGVLYSHRSATLHTLACCFADTLGIRESDTVLPVVPMFHANAWGLPYACLCAGASVVMPGPKLDADSLLDLMSNEKVTFAAGVPTIWNGILAKLDETPKKWDLSSVRTMLIGGSAAPPAMIDGFAKRYGITITHAWGMTEMSPIGTLARVKSSVPKDDASQLAAKASQGYPVPLVDQRNMSEDGQPIAWDKATMGELEVRGPWVASAYFGGKDSPISAEGESRFTKDGWFKTGDVVTIDEDGYMRICDRSKDVIKSGGEWISSVDLENALMAHPAILEAAVFAAKHEKWDERPVAAIVFKAGKTATNEELSAYVAERFAKFWIPDAFVVIDQVPRTSTGKFLKTKLRELYGDMLIKRA
jgi:fatty-acyl-CoA synthase